jgi:type II secretory pathway pseudopilin PulG
MCRDKGRSQGFTLVASLLVLLLLSAIAVSLLFMVQGAGQVGNNDVETSQAYYGAESGMELLTANLAALYQQSQSPTPGQITALTNNPPTSAMIGSMAYQEFITWTPDVNGNPASHTSVISPPSSNAGLSAEIIPLTLKVVATRPGGASVNMTRGVEVALIPVFQFGVFSDSDLSYFAGPDFNFQGRVHTNGNLFLAEGNGNALVLNDKVTAVGEVVRDRLANNFLTNANYTGDVYVLNQSQGCNGTVANATNPAVDPNCIKFTVPDASWSGGLPPVPAIGANCPAAGAACNLNWPNISTTVSPTTFGGWIGNGTSMAVQPLNLPFVQGANGAAQQIAIIRKAPLGELTTSATGSSREYNKANVRILLASNQADLHPDRPGLLAEDIDLTAGGCVASPQGKLVGPVVGTPGSTRIAMAATGQGDGGWVGPPTGSPCGAGPWNLIDGWLRVEYLNAAGAWVGITTEWLNLGFARGVNPPTKPVGGGLGSNPVHPNAILILQEQADRNANGNATDAVDAPNNTFDNGAILSQYSWYPINLFDPREGFPRDAVPPGMANPACYVNGIMNAVELDVGNFQKWVQGTVAGGSGPLVFYSGQNGYLVYFSDRRGMIPNPDPGMGGLTNGEYGFEDVINSASATGTPDNVLEPSEDADQNTILDTWGATNVGNGQRVATVVGGINNPYVNVNCSTSGRQNIVTGARHVLKLVDGGLGNLPVRPDNGLGGFTVASENPVYVQGNYNSDVTDPFWGNPPPAVQADINHAAAAVIADAVTVLSNNWSDTNSMLNPLNLAGRAPNIPTYYRLAIAGGKNINFLQPAGTGQDFGTDGGVHNFLRYIETWGGSGGLYYRGSLVSLYYSQYATGTFKCCNLVYGPPPRFYYFDNAFLDPAKLPPGTPMLQDVVNLTYWQDFKPY